MGKYRIVPVEPTEEMSTDGKHYVKGTDEKFERMVAVGVWNVMLAAAPSAADDAELVERVARALCRANQAQGPYFYLHAWVNQAWPAHADEARAVIRALEE